MPGVIDQVDPRTGNSLGEFLRIRWRDDAVRQKCSLPENDAGYAPIPNCSAESSNIYSLSAMSRNFEI